MKVTLKYLQYPTPTLPNPTPTREKQRSLLQKKMHFHAHYVKMLEACRAYEYANHHKHIASSMKAQTHKKIGRKPSHQIKNINQVSHTVYQTLEP